MIIDTPGHPRPGFRLLAFLLVLNTFCAATLTAQNKVGINTTNPAFELDVRTLTPDDGADINIGNSTNSHYLRLFSGKDATQFPNPTIYWNEINDSLIFGTYNSNTFTFQERMRISPSGVYASTDGFESTFWGESYGTFGTGIFGWSHAPDLGFGVRGIASGEVGVGVWGDAQGNSSSTNYGGYFQADGTMGIGAAAYAWGPEGIGVRGEASNDSAIMNYGGYFVADGKGGVEESGGVGVRGAGQNSNAIINYGGYFTADGLSGRAVYGAALNSGDYQNVGGYFEAAGTQGRAVYGNASQSSDSPNYGGYFISSGKAGAGLKAISVGVDGIGVEGHATGTNSPPGSPFLFGGRTYGGLFTAEAENGTGVRGVADGVGGNGVTGDGESVGVYGYSQEGTGVRGKSIHEYGVFGESVTGTAGYFEGDLCYTGVLGVCSDRRFKKDITRIEHALSGIIVLNGVVHSWRKAEFPDKNFPTEQSYGVIAQEVEPIFPNLVTEKEGYKYVDYPKFVPVLIEAIKEQQKQIEALQAQVEKQQVQLELLQTEVHTAREPTSQNYPEQN